MGFCFVLTAQSNDNNDDWGICLYTSSITVRVTDVDSECWLIISGLIISAKHIATVIVEEQGGADHRERRLGMLRASTQHW